MSNFQFQASPVFSEYTTDDDNKALASNHQHRANLVFSGLPSTALVVQPIETSEQVLDEASLRIEMKEQVA